MKPSISLRKALADPQLLGSVLAGDTWAAWRCLMIAAMGEALTNDERALFKQLTGREHEPLQRVEELIAVVGRRGGKSRAMSVLACYVASLCTHSLVRGERGVLLIIAPDQRQAGIVLGYCEAAFEQSPILRQLIANRSNDALMLTTGVSIEVRASAFRRLRGPTYVAVIADEAAFWHDDVSVNTDTEILNAVRPGLSTTDGPLIIASSPYARKGVLYEMYKHHYGPAGDPLILVMQGTSREFNPSLPQRVVDRALARDHAAASADYLAQFRSDIESFVDREAVQSCISLGVHERSPIPDVTYSAFVDPSGGSAEAMTLAVGHSEDGVVIIDCIRESRAPFNPDNVVAEFAQLLKSYQITAVQGDRYGGTWVRDRFREYNISYENAAKPKSDLYQDLLPAINSHKVDLLDNDRLFAQLCSLERRTVRGGRDSIDHPKDAHDDVANAVAGVVSMLATDPNEYDQSYDWVFGKGKDPNKPDPEWQQQRYANFIATGGYKRPW